MDITPNLTLTGTLYRNSPSLSASKAFADGYAAVKTGVRCRISQPAKQRAVVGLQPAADLNPVALFEPDEDVRDQDRITITAGTAGYVGTTWDLYAPVVPSVPLYLSATARRIETAAG